MNSYEGTLALSRGKIKYIRFGSGKRCFLMLAGMSMAGIGGLGEAVAEMYSAFTEDYTVYLFDALDMPPEGTSVRDMAADIAEAMDALGIKDACVFGASQGGMIAQYLAIDRPELVRAMLLSSSCCRMSDTAKRVFIRWTGLADAGDAEGIYREFFRNVYTVPMEPPEELLRSATPGQCRRFSVLTRAALGFDSRDELKKISCPVFVTGSSADRVLGNGAASELARILGCPSYIYGSLGHAVYDEAPDHRDRILHFFGSVYSTE